LFVHRPIVNDVNNISGDEIKKLLSIFGCFFPLN